ncbi:MAG: hypothetical protein FWD65_04665 [Coriobacteriia bacterium]|nr:hypothetical protein [Coriobacteriia bacterium]
MNKQMKLIFALVVVVVVLMGAIVFIATRPSNTTSNNTGTGAAATTSTGTSTSGTSASFDAKTATKVPAGQTPEVFVENYYKAVAAGNYEAAYQLLPQAKKEGQSVADFATQLKAYSITGYKMGASSTSGDTMTINADEITAGNGSFTMTWTFVKQGSTWLVKDRFMPGMQSAQ